MTRARDVADTQENNGGGVPPFTAGKNKIINGDFFVNQRVFTSNTTAGTFNFDRFYQINSGGSFTLTPQTFTPGAAPVSGYEGKTFLQAITASQSAAGDYAAIVQNIESVRNFAGQTATLSFWAKANTGTPKITVELAQSFGTGGSPSAAVTTYAGQITLSTSWARYFITVDVPAISGKTLGTNNNDYLQVVLWTSAGSTFNARTGSLGIQNFTAQIWGVQMEAGNVATAFTTATGTIQGELAACQRYCYVIQGNTTNASSLGTAYWNGTTAVVGFLSSKSQMRTTPTLIYSQASDLEALQTGVSWNAVSAVVLASEASVYTAPFQVTTTGGTNGQAANIRLKALSTAFIGLVAEL
jgi:hypothetical protein